MQIIEMRTEESQTLIFSGKINNTTSKRLEDEIASWAISRFTEKLILDFFWRRLHFISGTSSAAFGTKENEGKTRDDYQKSKYFL